MDLHGVRHGDVPKEIDSFLWAYGITHQILKVECGNSERMIKIVTDFLTENKYSWMKSISGGHGTILLY